jgi:hypothetical protein
MNSFCLVPRDVTKERSMATPVSELYSCDMTSLHQLMLRMTAAVFSQWRADKQETGQTYSVG